MREAPIIRYIHTTSVYTNIRNRQVKVLERSLCRLRFHRKLSRIYRDGYKISTIIYFFSLIILFEYIHNLKVLKYYIYQIK